MAALLHGYGRQTFNIHGVRLVVAADDGWIRDGVREALQVFQAPVAQADAGMLLMAGTAGCVNRHELCGPGNKWRRRENPRGATEFRFGAMRCYRAGERLVYSDGASTLIVDPERGRAEGTLCRGAGERPDAPWRAWQQPVFTFPFLELLRHRGLYHLHAAALEREGEGVVLAGDSGCGKTTLTLLLARAGWGFLSDDAVWLRLTARGVEALAFPAPFHADPALGALLPELAPLLDAPPYNAGWKRELRPERLFGRAFSPSARPRLLLLPRVHHGDGPRHADAVAPGIWLRPLGPGQAVAELIRASALVLLDARAAAGHLESLRLLATGCAAYRLYHGPDLLRAPELFVSLIERLLVETIDARLQRDWDRAEQYLQLPL